MGLLAEAKGKVDPFGELPMTRPGSCPIHQHINKFVRVPWTNVYICPEIKHRDVIGYKDSVPGKTEYDR
jgi:hypothetical protein